MAMGYMVDWARDPVVDEEIQMHADKLYRAQVEKDKLIEERASLGQPIKNGEVSSEFIPDGKVADAAAQAFRNASASGKGGQAA